MKAVATDDEMDGQEPLSDLCCRICLDDDERKNLIAPCSCSGGSKWVHRSCLDRWRTVNEDRAFSRCTECLTEYMMVSLVDDSEESKRKRKRLYYWRVFRDSGMMFLLTQGVIAIFSGITYLCDNSKGSLLHEFGMEHHPKVFYYLCGLIFASATVGLISMIIMCCTENLRNNSNPCPYCYIYSGDVGAAGPGECCAGCSCDCSGCERGGCGSAACEGVNCGEAGPFVLVIIAGLAIIGIVVAIIAGVAFIQNVMQKHIHVLYKQGLARDIVVKDLAAEDGGLTALRLHGNTGVDGSHEYMNVDSQNPLITASAPASYESDNMMSELIERGEAPVPSAPLLTLEQRRELAASGLL